MRRVYAVGTKTNQCNVGVTLDLTLQMNEILDPSLIVHTLSNKYTLLRYLIDWFVRFEAPRDACLVVRCSRISPGFYTSEVQQAFVHKVQNVFNRNHVNQQWISFFSHLCCSNRLFICITFALYGNIVANMCDCLAEVTSKFELRWFLISMTKFNTMGHMVAGFSFSDYVYWCERCRGQSIEVSSSNWRRCSGIWWISHFTAKSKNQVDTETWMHWPHVCHIITCLL